MLPFSNVDLTVLWLGLDSELWLGLSPSGRWTAGRASSPGIHKTHRLVFTPPPLCHWRSPFSRVRSYRQFSRENGGLRGDEKVLSKPQTQLAALPYSHRQVMLTPCLFIEYTPKPCIFIWNCSVKYCTEVQTEPMLYMYRAEAQTPWQN